jgi:hypothetical protein
MANKRADRIWLRLIQAYGSRVAESYGEDMPSSWVDAVEDISDQQIDYGMRKVVRDTPIHPPTLGQFVAACVDMPQAQPKDKGPTIQEQLCAYVTLVFFSGLNLKQFALPWTYLYREWIDESRPKHFQKCAECVGVLIPEWDEHHPAVRITVAQMLGDKEGHAKALRSFQPGPPPTREQRKNWMDATVEHARKLRGNDGASP